ncbi:MAG: DUF2089 family protein [Deltaproteobacteria bacterium]|nr:DUF2089 family protein [Deltaproteobacteria bacterium]
MHKTPDNCPICSGLMYVRELACHDCGTRIKGSFESRGNPFAMDGELFEFIKVFIFAEGSIKQSEKILNCSYPKIKNLLKKAKTALGFENENTDTAGSIIDQLDQGKIDVEAALNKLKNA